MCTKLMNTLDYIVKKFKLDVSAPSPIEILSAGRNDLAEWLHDLDFKIGVEIGVDEGEYSEILCKANPQMKVYGVDPYESYNGLADYQTVEEFKVAQERAKDRLSKFPKYVFIKEFSMDALKRFADNSLDFVYIDANHTDPYVTWDLAGWSKKVKSGGIVSGHDYQVWEGSWNVVEAVNKYIKNNHIKHWFILGIKNTLSGIFVDAKDGSKSFWVRYKSSADQDSNPIDDTVPSWMFVKK